MLKFPISDALSWPVQAVVPQNLKQTQVRILTPIIPLKQEEVTFKQEGR